MEPGARTPGALLTRARTIAVLGLAALTAVSLGVTERAAGGPQAAADADGSLAATEVPTGFGHEDRLPVPDLDPEPAPAAVAVNGSTPARVAAQPRASRDTRPIEDVLLEWVPPVIDSTGIPVTVLKAYKNARRIVDEYNPNCHLTTALLGAIGRVESDHAFGGYVDRQGRTLSPILGPRLDGHPGVKAISDSDGGLYDGDTKYDRAVGPMQFIPSTWMLWAADGNADKVGDPNNVYDAALSAGWYLCHGGADLADPKAFKAAVLRYNGSESYYKTVKVWTQAYRKALNPVPDEKDASAAQLRVEQKAAAERAALAAKAAAEARQRAAAPPAAQPAAPAAAPLSPALEPVADGGRPAETGAGKAAPGAPVVPRAPQPAPAAPAPATAPAKPVTAESRPSTDERRDQKPAAGGEAVGNTLSGLARPKGGGSAPAAPPKDGATAPVAPPKADAGTAPAPPPTGFPLG